MSAPFSVSSSEKKAIYVMERNKGRTLRVLNTHHRQTHDKHIQFLEKEKQRSRKMIDLECDGYYDRLEHHLVNLYPNTPQYLLEEIRTRNTLPSRKDDANENLNQSGPKPKEPSKQIKASQRPFSEASPPSSIPFSRSKTAFECRSNDKEGFEETRSTRSKHISLPEPISLSNTMSALSVTNKQSLQTPFTANTLNTEDEFKGGSDQDRWGKKNCQIPLNPSTLTLPSKRKTLLLRCKTSLPENYKPRKCASSKAQSRRDIGGSRPTEMFVSDLEKSDADTDEIARSNQYAQIGSGSDASGVGLPAQNEARSQDDEDRHDYSHLMYSSIFCLPPVHTNEPRPLVARSWSPPPRPKVPKNSMDEFKQLRFCRYLRRSNEL